MCFYFFFNVTVTCHMDGNLSGYTTFGDLTGGYLRGSPYAPTSRPQPPVITPGTPQREIVDQTAHNPTSNPVNENELERRIVQLEKCVKIMSSKNSFNTMFIYSLLGLLIIILIITVASVITVRSRRR
jgi:hypothetical protein